MLVIDINGTEFTAECHESEAPESVAAVRDLLPLESDLLHVRWSGIATWINIDEIDLPEIPRENHTVYPSRGDLLLYPGYRNEQEILFACGPTCFKSPAGELAGNHFASVNATAAELKAIERLTLRDGSQPVTIRSSSE
ncbi:DUF3830 family protein [Halorubrum sp. AD140]|uniref:DUF3830 family protein n=1 Tax=Halorubrum sp. AD140 TaxID=3050073 RepID=UPI002ACC5AB3|nr:DUF3830 family protein [Halorubrum sp. AD140]MDZ5811530.1 DUF3830 family protein [Halorubrum sp. AD140]